MNCVSPKTVYPAAKPIIVPCGKCLACLSNKRKDWIFRLKQEYKASKGALFVTLTYSDKFNPEVLVKRHVQLYMKKLRKYVKGKIRYYCVGEYGTRTDRPHYHILMFGKDLPEDYIRKAWTTSKNRKEEPFGHVHIGQVSEASIAYCTKYIVQPADVKKKSFSLMSRAYGLGLSYLTDRMVEWHRADDRNYSIQYGQKVRLPRYYKDKIWYRIKTKEGEVIEHKSRKEVGEKSKWYAIKEYRKNLRIYVEQFGVENAKAKMIEGRNAVLSHVKTKVSFTQNL